MNDEQDVEPMIICARPMNDLAMQIDHRHQRSNGTLLHVDPWAKVAECERAIAIVADPERRIVLLSLRDFWIALGDELPRASAHDQTDRRSTMPLPHTHLATVAEIHAQLMAGCRNAMH